MWTISQIICIGSLTGLSVSDIYYRKVSGELITLGGIGALIYQIWWGRLTAWALAGGIAVGILFLIISRVTKEGIGYGDSFAILVLGVYLGVWDLLKVLTCAFSLLLAATTVALCIKRMSRKHALPFFPFLTGGFLIGMLAV